MVLDRVDEQRRAVRSLLDSDELRALRQLAGVSALQPRSADTVARQLVAIAGAMFSCPDPSRSSVTNELQGKPVHRCGLTFENGPDEMAAAQRGAAEARSLFDTTLNRTYDVLLSATVRERLAQGQHEPAIAAILACGSVGELRAALVALAATTPNLGEVINRYLKRIVVRRVKIADFAPSSSTIERDQIPALAREFQRYLEAQLNAIDDDDDAVPVLQVE